MRDIDRATLGFCPLGDYESKLEEDLPNSDLAVDIIEQFEIINDLHRKFENFVISYDSLLATVYKGNIIKNLIMDCQSYTKYRPNETTGGNFCIMAEKGGTSHGGLTEKLSPFFHAKKQEVNAYGR